ncbi:LysR family transcriptional regulator [Aquirhabdus sp.]|uniref:LysR family transcriptional regulator n=1 Tax=Aquirhabdus sp. TaxID=2824160 RepID=UPI00396CAE40
MLDWENLHYFAVFSHEKSLSAAARKLGVDHATVARRIAVLEASLQLKLVDRRPRAYVLTVDGERIASIADQMVEGAFSIGRIAKAGQQSISGEVSISVPPATAANFIVPHLAKLRQQYPNILLSMIAETRIASLPHGEADIAVRLSRPTEDDLVARKIGMMPFAFYAAPDYLAKTRSEDYVFIALDSSLVQSVQQRWLSAHLADRPIVLRTNSPEIQRIAACAGVGVAVLPYFLGELGGLARVGLGEGGLEREIWLAVHQDLHNTPAVRAVMDFLVDCFTQHGSHGI